MKSTLLSYPRIQIAGIRDKREFDLLVTLGVDDIGFPLGPGVRTPDMPEDEAHFLAKVLRGTAVGAVAIVYLKSSSQLLQFREKYPAFTKIQLHGELPLSELKRFREKDPSCYLIKSLIVRKSNRATLKEKCFAWAPYINAFLTDSYDPVTGATGATGKVHDWAVSRELVSISPRPVILAGGLTPANVEDAIATVSPAGVDVHSGIESASGEKTLTLSQEFVLAARRAFAKN